MKKIIITISTILVLIIGFYVTLYLYEDSKAVTKKEALELAKPAINVILDYKKKYGKYPSDLIKLKNFPYKLRKIDSYKLELDPNEYKSEYEIEDRNRYTIYYYPHNTKIIDKHYHRVVKTSLSIDFFWSRKVGAINIYFDNNGLYKIDYSAGSLGPGA